MSIQDQVRKRGIKVARSYHQIKNIKTYRGIDQIVFIVNNPDGVSRTMGYDAKTTFFIVSENTPMSILRMKEVREFLQERGIEIESSHSQKRIIIK